MVGPPVPVGEALDIAQQRPDVRQQVVAEQHRLGMLEMGAARHRHTEVAIRLREKGIDGIEHATGEVVGLLAEVHPEQGRDLVIAGAARAQTSADMGAGALDQAPLQGGVHVLVVLGGSEGAGDDICFELVQAGQHRRECVVVEEASGREDLRVGTAARDVVARQAPVEVGRLRQCC